jgi:hypothetical protein
VLGCPSIGLSEEKRVAHGELGPEDIGRRIGFGTEVGFDGFPSGTAAPIPQQIGCEIEGVLRRKFGKGGASAE